MSRGELPGPLPAESASPDSEPPDTAGPPARLPRWAVVLIGVIGLLLMIGVDREKTMAAALLPPPGSWFGSGQTVSVPVSAGESQTVYWEFENAVSEQRATADCRASDRQSGAEIPLNPLGGDLRVDNHGALVTITPARSGTIDLTCLARGAARAEFGVAREIPAPRPLSGVENAGRGADVFLTAAKVAGPVLFVLWLCPLPPAVRAWLFWFWAPLLLTAVLIVAFASVESGLVLGVAWYLTLGVLRLRLRERLRRRLSSPPDRAVHYQPPPVAVSAPPPPPRGWFGDFPDRATVRFCGVAGALFGIPGLLGVGAVLHALVVHDGRYAAGMGLLALFALSLAVSLLMPVINPAPRVVRSDTGMAINSARVIPIALGVVGITLMALLVLLGLSVAFGHPVGSTSSGQRRSYAIPGLAVFTVAILVPYMVRTVRTRRRGGAPRFQVTLTPAGIRFSDQGRAVELAWEEITDVRVGPPGVRLAQRMGPSQLYLFTATGGSVPFMVDRYLQMGGVWLVDTISYYWQHPQARPALASAA